VNHPTRRRALALVAALAATAPMLARADAAKLDAKVDAAVAEMTATVSGTAELLAQAKGVLVIPEIVKAGLLVGGAYGEGALRVGGQSVGYYQFAEASVGLQAGAQRFGSAVFFMTDAALETFQKAKGWQVGADAEVTVLDKGFAAGLDSVTKSAPVIAVVFGQDGLLAGASIAGGKYTQIVP
jgi:lipid-binding SYLF domain-containing protein